MLYSKPMWKKTQEGRVVYDRKKHAFTSVDCVRIGGACGAQVVPVLSGNWDAYLDMHFPVIALPGAPGGRFGGAGASRTWGPMPIPAAGSRLILIVEVYDG